MPSLTWAAALRPLLLLLGLLPWVPAALVRRPRVLVAAFAAHCHQLPERTLWLSRMPMVVCSRCAGIYAGIALAALLPAPPLLDRHGRALVLTSGALMLLDVALQGHHPLWQATRLGTGLLVGWSATAWVLRLLQGEPLARS